MHKKEISSKRGIILNFFLTSYIYENFLNFWLVLVIPCVVCFYFIFWRKLWNCPYSFFFMDLLIFRVCAYDSGFQTEQINWPYLFGSLNNVKFVGKKTYLPLQYYTFKWKYAWMTLILFTKISVFSILLL
jgi:hypothetical protein